MQIQWNKFSVHFILKSNIKRILNKISNFSVEYFCSYKKIKTITFLNSIIFKNRFLENYAYHFKIKKYVLKNQKKILNAKKNLGVKSPVEWPLYCLCSLFDSA